MNSKLNNALAELKRAGAKNIPSVALVESASDGTSWKGEGWELTKNGESSFSCMIGK